MIAWMDTAKLCARVPYQYFARTQKGSFYTGMHDDIHDLWDLGLPWKHLSRSVLCPVE